MSPNFFFTISFYFNFLVREVSAKAQNESQAKKVIGERGDFFPSFSFSRRKQETRSTKKKNEKTKPKKQQKSKIFLCDDDGESGVFFSSFSCIRPPSSFKFSNLYLFRNGRVREAREDWRGHLWEGMWRKLLFVEREATMKEKKTTPAQELLFCSSSLSSSSPPSSMLSRANPSPFFFVRFLTFLFSLHKSRSHARTGLQGQGKVDREARGAEKDAARGEFEKDFFRPAGVDSCFAFFFSCSRRFFSLFVANSHGGEEEKQMRERNSSFFYSFQSHRRHACVQDRPQSFLS